MEDESIDAQNILGLYLPVSVSTGETEAFGLSHERI